MTGLVRFIPGGVTALTWLKAFKVECLYLGIAAALAGAALGGWASHKATKVYYRGEVAEARAETERARAELVDWKAAQVQARLDARVREAKIMAEAKERYDAQTSSIDGVAAELRRLAAGVRVCTQVSSLQLRVPEPAAGPAEAPAGGVARPADVVLQELAAEFARRADSNAAAYNSLMERWERLAAESRPPVSP